MNNGIFIIFVSKFMFKNYLFCLVAISFLVVLDQVSKYFFFKGVFNTGISFGIKFPMGLIVFASFIFLIFLIYLRYKKQINKISFILLLSGLLGNLIDRIFLGGVRDFIDLKIWPVFNLADVYLTLGVILFLLDLKTNFKL